MANKSLVEHNNKWIIIYRIINTVYGFKADLKGILGKKTLGNC